jgi:small nuclear ribonucleoprotein (snRNP)-like protein
MRIRTRHFATIVILLTSFLLSPVTLMAQVGPNDWSRLNSVAQGSTLSVKLKNGKKMEGTFSSVSDTALTLMVKNASSEVKRDDVRSVHQVGGTSVTKSTLIGLGAGAGAGALLGAVGSAADNDNGFPVLDGTAVTAGLTVLGAAAGAITGFVIGKTRKKKVLLYQAK